MSQQGSTSSTLRRKAKRVGSNDAASAPEPLVVPPSGMVRRRIPELAVGVLLMAMCALLAVFVLGGQQQAVPVVVMGNSVPRGDLVTAADLAIIEIAFDGSLNAVEWEQRSTLVGKAALTDLPAGVIPSSSSVASAAVLGDGMRALGVVLDAGAVPDPRITIGDRVDILLPNESAADGPGPVAAALEVLQVSREGNSWFLTFAVPEPLAGAVADAFSSGDVRLAVVPA